MALRDKYIELRVEPTVCFYQSRLPGYYRRVTMGAVILAIGALTGTFLAFLNADEWTAVATAVTSGVTAWVAYHGTRGKISRCASSFLAFSLAMQRIDRLSRCCAEQIRTQLTRSWTECCGGNL